MNRAIVGLSGVAMAMSMSISAAADRVLIASHWAGPNHAMATEVFPWLSDTLMECSNGTLSVKIENGLAPPPAQYDTVRDGVADLGWIVHGYTPGKFVATRLIEVPGMPGTAEQLSVAFQKTHEKFFASAGEAKGVEVLANFVHGPGMVNTTDKITSYGELKGLKLRVGGGVANQVGEALGVVGVNVPAPAVYETIATGVADGVFFPGESLYSFKIAEHTKYSLYNPDGMYTTSFAMLLNSDTYADLSDEHRGCVDQLSGVPMAQKIGSVWDEADRFGLEKAKAEYGLEVIEASDAERASFTEATAGIRQAVLDQINERGIDANAALEYLLSELP